MSLSKPEPHGEIMALRDDKGDGKAHETPRPHEFGSDLKRFHKHARPVGGDTTLCQTLQKECRSMRIDGLLLEQQFNRRISDQACVALPQHNAIWDQNVSMLLRTSLCDMSHEFKNLRELPPPAFLCIWSQINVGIRHSPQRIKTVCPSWLELPRGISHVRNDKTPFKESCPLP